MYLCIFTKHIQTRGIKKYILKNCVLFEWVKGAMNTHKHTEHKQCIF